MSRLLPLVAAALNDKIAAETHLELLALREEVNASHAVEIVRVATDDDDEDRGEVTTAHASAQFQEGSYCREYDDFWQVDMNPGSTTCRLADLRDFRVCLGGGFVVESLDDLVPNRSLIGGSFKRDDEDSDNSKAVSICFGEDTLWLKILVHGWPRVDWEPLMERHELCIDPLNCISVLVDEVAVDYPEAMVEFRLVFFAVETIRGPLQKLLSAKRKEEVRAERDGVDILINYVSSEVEEDYDCFGSESFDWHVHFLTDMLIRLDIHERNNYNVEKIDAAIAAYNLFRRELVCREHPGLERVLEDGDSMQKEHIIQGIESAIHRVILES